MSKDYERWRNLVVLHVWMTNEELAKNLPVFIIMAVIVIVAGVILYGCGT